MNAKESLMFPTVMTHVNADTFRTPRHAIAKSRFGVSLMDGTSRPSLPVAKE